MSGKLKAIGISSDTALNKFAGLQSRAVQVNKNFKALGRNVTTLSDKLALMRAERDLIPERNIRDVRRYNTEIQKLEKRITRLNTVNNTSRLKSLTRDAMMTMPGGAFLTNPIVAVSAAVGGLSAQALNFDEGMAKINITAQMSKDELSGLKREILDVGKAMKADPGRLPETFEKILSQVGDVDLSMNIFESTLKGAKAGFTDTSIVADALAQSLSAIGPGQENAQQVLDILFAAKRVGAGEFGDFARYVPGLIADARNLGVAFQDTAGLFAFMTGKGNTAERSAMLIQNAMSALSKTDIQDKLAMKGINIFDEDGATRSITAIMADMRTKLDALGTDAARSNFLDAVGLRDVQAKSAISILTSDIGKLETTLQATANAAGETDAALEFSKNPLQKLTDMWNTMKYSLLEAGGGLVTILEPLMSVGGVLLEVINPVLGWIGEGMQQVAGFLNWIISGLEKGNPLIYAFAGALSAYAVATHAVTVAQKIATIATGAWSAAVGFLNAVFYASPIGWIVAGVGALVGVVVLAWNKFEGFRKTVFGLWDAFKQVFKNIGNFFKKIFEPIFEAIDAFKEGRWKDAAIASGKAFFNLSPAGLLVQSAKFNAEGGFTKGVADAFKQGQEKGVKQEKDKLPTVDAPPTINVNPNPLTTNPTTGNGLNSANQSAQAIATGGQKTQNFNISIGKLIEQFDVENHDGAGIEEIKDKVLDALLRALNMSQTLANG